MPFLIEIGVVGFLLALGFGVGTWRERSHFKSIQRREAEFQDIGIVNLKTVQNPETIAAANLVMADCVIATDYFKGFIASWRNIFGGEMRSYQTLMERARREAVLRLLAQAREQGANELWNIRLETSNVMSSTNRKSPSVAVEITAFATAVQRR